MRSSSRIPGFFARWILPFGILILTSSYDTSLPDPFHAWRWTLLGLVATLGLLSLVPGANRPSLGDARLPLLLACGAAAFTLLSLAAARNPGEGLWQAAQTVAWAGWLLYAVAAGSTEAGFWARLRGVAVTLALLGGGVAVLDYWGAWSPGIDPGLGLGPGGLHGNRNLLASFHLLLAPWILWACLEARGPGRLAALSAWSLFAYVLAITQSRAAWVGTAVMAAAGLALLLSRPGGPGLAPALAAHRRTALALAAPLLAAFLFHAGLKPPSDRREGTLARAASLADPGFASNAQRLALWGKTVTLIRENPWLGVGAGHWKIALPSTGMAGLLWQDMSLTEVRPYNDWLWAAAETGIPGGLCWLGAWAAAMAIGVRAARGASGAARTPALLFTAALAGFGAVSASDFPRERPEHMAWYALALAFLACRRGGVGILEVTHSSYRPGPSAAWNAAAGPVLASAALAAALAALLGWERCRNEARVGQALAAHAQEDWARAAALAAAVDEDVCPFNRAASPIAWHEGIARHHLGDPGGAERAFLRALERHPWHLPTLHNLAVSRLAAGDTAGALARLDQALAISPAFAEAALGRAWLSLRRGESVAARQALDAVAADGRGPRWQSLDRLWAASGRTLP